METQQNKADSVAKRRHTDISSTTQSTDETTRANKQLVIVPKEPTAIVTSTTLDPNRPVERGRQSRFSEDEVLTFRDLPAEVFELGAILQHDKTYELIDFFARLLVVATSRMAQEHAEQQVIERALDNELT